jgi:hypothetical protein
VCFLVCFFSMHEYAFVVMKSDGHDMFSTKSDPTVHTLLNLNGH